MWSYGPKGSRLTSALDIPASFVIHTSSGQLGTGRSLISSTPVFVSGLSRIVTVASGETHVLGLDRDGAVWAWGDNGLGQLGDGTTAARSTPGRVSGLPPVTAIAAGSIHSAALAADGSVWVPSREDLDSSPLLRTVTLSSEEQRLSDIYSKRGLAALVAELNRF